MHPADFLKQVWPVSIPAAQYVTALQIVEAMAKKADPPPAEAPPITAKRVAKPKMKRRVDAQRAAIRSLRATGKYTAKGLARALGLSLETIRRRLAEMDSKPPSKRLDRSAEMRAVWAALATGPATSREIADAAGLEALFVGTRLSEAFRKGLVDREQISETPPTFRYRAKRGLAQVA